MIFQKIRGMIDIMTKGVDTHRSISPEEICRIVAEGVTSSESFLIQQYGYEYKERISSDLRVEMADAKAVSIYKRRYGNTSHTKSLDLEIIRIGCQYYLFS